MTTVTSAPKKTSAPIRRVDAPSVAVLKTQPETVVKVQPKSKVNVVPVVTPAPSAEPAPATPAALPAKVKAVARKAKDKVVVPVVTTTVAPVVTTPVAATPVAPSLPKLAVSSVPEEQEDQEQEDQEEDYIDDDVEESLQGKKKRQRPRLRTYEEIYSQISDNINNAYKALQSAQRALKSLESAHNREVNNTKSRVNVHRTPTIVFDQTLVDYFTSHLDASDLIVNRKEGDVDVSVDLSELTTDTRVHRTDVTQLYNKCFVKHNLRDDKDRRYILYQNDPDLVHLLTAGAVEAKPELKDDVAQILAGTYKLSIFNIQRFTSHHLGKVDLPNKEVE